MDFKKYIWDLFPYFYKEHDTYKDGDGQGVLERFIKLCGEELNEYINPYLDETSEHYYMKNLDPMEAEQKFLKIISEFLGNPPNPLGTSEFRILLNFILQLYQIKGTIKGYELFFSLLGFDTTITELTPSDQSATNLYDTEILHDKQYIYDEDSPTCKTSHCSYYTLDLTPIDPEFTLTTELDTKLKQIVKFIEPINARLQVAVMAPLTNTQTRSFCIQQHLSLKLEYHIPPGESPEEGSYDDYFLATWDCDGVMVALDSELLTFDNEDVTFDIETVEWSRVYI